MQQIPNLRGLYVITDQTLTPAISLLTQVKQALQGGASLVQYRNKSDPFSVRYEQALALRALCHDFAALFIVNDDLELAIQVAADGVHLGQQDTPLVEARRVLGTNKLIGITCHDQLKLARQAHQEGADYLAFGAIYPTQTKPNASRAPLSILAQARAFTDRPICAIGGIHANNAQEVIAAGADMLAVAGGIFAHADPTVEAQKISQLYATRH